jgi:hypothetical protein
MHPCVPFYSASRIQPRHLLSIYLWSAMYLRFQILQFTPKLWLSFVFLYDLGFTKWRYCEHILGPLWLILPVACSELFPVYIWRKFCKWFRLARTKYDLSSRQNGNGKLSAVYYRAFYYFPSKPWKRNVVASFNIFAFCSNFTYVSIFSYKQWKYRVFNLKVDR